MKTYDGVHELPTPLQNSSVTIGNFDGVHLGHREIIDRITTLAAEAGGPSVVVTFFPHPRQVLAPEQKLTRVLSFEDQKAVFESLGVDVLVVQPFLRALSEVPAEEFLKNWILSPLGMKNLVVGYDFSFGANRKGTLSLLEQMSKSHKFHLEIVEAFRLGQRLGRHPDEEVISSSRIRREVVAGHVHLANLMLGRPFYLEGLVEKGAGRGHTIGIPTANLSTHAETIPKKGVYVTRCLIGSTYYPSVTNVGYNPTFQANSPFSEPQPKIETHILDFHQMLYGEKLRVEFLNFIRDEQKFSGVEELVAQIKKDMEQARKSFV